MDIFNHYLHRHNIPVTSFEYAAKQNLRCIVVIPSFNEESPEKILESICKCFKPAKSVEILFVFNSPINAEKSILDRNKEGIDKIEKYYSKVPEWMKINSLHYQNLPKKHAGAGLARKLGMDAAIQRFSQNNISDGYILCLDADCKVSKDYIRSAEAAFENKNANLLTFGFSHLVDLDIPKENIIAAGLYELHLRYYKMALKSTGFPYSVHTIGSCFGVDAKTYCRHGGMNKRQAGEDFYFIQKVLPNSTHVEINKAMVYPSARISNRVVFGTGSEITAILKNGLSYKTYCLKSFIILKELFESLPHLFESSENSVNEIINSFNTELSEFLNSTGFQSELMEIKRNISSYESFKKRFFGVFDAFRVVKYLNFVHANFFSKLSVESQALELISLFGKTTTNNSIEELVRVYEKWESEVN